MIFKNVGSCIICTFRFLALYVDVSENVPLLASCISTYLYDKLDINKSPDAWLDQQAQFVSDPY